MTQVNYYISQRYGEALYDSCKSVKFGSNNQFAMELLGNNAKDYLAMARFQGKMKPGFGSPFQIDFPDMRHNSTLGRDLGIFPQDASMIDCYTSDPQYECSCTDCQEKCPILEGPLISPYDICQSGGHACATWVLLSVYIVLILALNIFSLYKYFRKRHISLNSAIAIPSPPSGKSVFQASAVPTSNMSVNEVFHTPVSPKDLESHLLESEEVYRQTNSSFVFPKSAVDRHISTTTDTFTDPLLSEPILTQPKKPYWLNRVLYRVFYAIGHASVKRPWLTIMLAFIAVLAASSGSIWYFQVETDPIHLWVSPASVAAQQKMYFDEEFGPFYRTTQLIFTLRDFEDSLDEGEASIIQRDLFRRLFTIHKNITELQANITLPDGTQKKFDLKSVCFQPLQDGHCVVQSVTGYWQNDLATFDKKAPTDEAFLKEFRRCSETPTNCLPDFLQPLRGDLLYGGFEGNEYYKSKAIIITYVINNSIDPLEREGVIAWEQELLKYLSSLQTRVSHWRKLSCGPVSLSYSSEVCFFINL